MKYRLNTRAFFAVALISLLGACNSPANPPPIAPVPAPAPRPKSNTTAGQPAVTPEKTPDTKVEPTKTEVPKTTEDPPKSKDPPVKPDPTKTEYPKKTEDPPKATPATTGVKAAADPFDWPHWRGPEQNGISRETGLVDTWSPDGENLLWKKEELGSRSTPIVMRGKLYLLARDKPETLLEGEKVVCADAATGETLWENRFNVFLSDVPATRVGWSNVIGDPETGRVFAQSVCGYVQCIDGDSGKTLWSHSMSEEYGLLSTYGGRTNSPVLFENLVIVSGVVIGWGEMAKPAHRFIAFDKNTGRSIWFSSTRLLPEDTTYSTPITTVLNGQAAMVFGCGDGALYAMQPRTGKIIWKYQLSPRGLNTTPLVIGNKVYTGHSEENIDDTTMGALVAVDGTGEGDVTKTKELWRTKELTVGCSSPVLFGERIYAAADGGTLLVVDAKTGEEIASEKLGTIMRGSLLYADGKIFANESNGRSHIFKITDDGLELVQHQRLPGQIHASPIVSHGRIYMQTTNALYCIGRPDQKPAASERPALAVEDPITDMQPAQVQLTPVESLLKPGEKLPLETRLYNARGQFLKVADDAEISASGGGTLEKNVFTSAADAGHAGVVLSAKVGELSTTARLRIVPPLPWKFDFEDNEIPISWIGARYRHIVRDEDGSKVMVKVTTIPKGTRSQGWMGNTDLSNYTIQADVSGRLKDNKMPDIGVQAQRYRLEMMGAAQQLKVYSWISHEQKYKIVPFEWSANEWYTMKFRASSEMKNGKPVAHLQGKVWKRGEAEPAKWQIESVDESPDTFGSPGLFGNANTSEIFYDNVTVTPNAP